MQPPPRRKPRYWPIAVIIGLLTVALCGGGLFVAALAARTMADRVENQIAMGPGVRDPLDILDELESMPGAKAQANWDGDQIAVVVDFASGKQPVNEIVVESILLDNYLPDIKVPHRVKLTGPKRTGKLKVKFPGFDSRGGKYAKLNLQYSFGNTSTSEAPGLYIPLRKKK